MLRMNKLFGIILAVLLACTMLIVPALAEETTAAEEETTAEETTAAEETEAEETAADAAETDADNVVLSDDESTAESWTSHPAVTVIGYVFAVAIPVAAIIAVLVLMPNSPISKKK